MNTEYRVIDMGDCYSIEKVTENNGKLSHTSSKSIFVVYKKEGVDWQITMRELNKSLAIGINKPLIIAKEKSNVNKKGSTKSVVRPQRREGSTSKK